MASKCLMCGREISTGILCDKCDKPRKSKTVEKPLPASAKPAAAAAAPAPEPAAAPAPTPPAPAAPAAPAARVTLTGGAAAAPAVALEAFPKAPVVPFPVESSSPAITSICQVIMAGGVAAVVLGSDRSVKFVSEEARQLFGATQNDPLTVKGIEKKSGLVVGELTMPATAGFRLGSKNILYSLVPLSAGATGAVLVFRSAEQIDETRVSFATFVRETVLGPLRDLRESLLAASKSSQRDPQLLLGDTAATIDQILSSLEMAPAVQDVLGGTRIPTLPEIVRSVADKFIPFAELKNVQLQVDAADVPEHLRDHESLAENLGILVENSMHYVPPGGQVVIGLRQMEHKGKPLLLFFVMDNGAVVPEDLRQQIFEPGFVWQPNGAQRTGRNLSRAREFAIAHGGQVWVESKTGKACTFFLRIRPDGVR